MMDRRKILATFLGVAVAGLAFGVGTMAYKAFGATPVDSDSFARDKVHGIKTEVSPGTHEYVFYFKNTEGKVYALAPHGNWTRCWMEPSGKYTKRDEHQCTQPISYAGGVPS